MDIRREKQSCRKTREEEEEIKGLSSGKKKKLRALLSYHFSYWNCVILLIEESSEYIQKISCTRKEVRIYDIMNKNMNVRATPLVKDKT